MTLKVANNCYSRPDVIPVYPGILDPASGHQPAGRQQVRLHHQPPGQGEDSCFVTWSNVSHDVMMSGPAHGGLGRVEAGAPAGGDHWPGLVQLPGQARHCSKTDRRTDRHIHFHYIDYEPGLVPRPAAGPGEPRHPASNLESEHKTTLNSNLLHTHYVLLKKKQSHNRKLNR